MSLYFVYLESKGFFPNNKSVIFIDLDPSEEIKDWLKLNYIGNDRVIRGFISQWSSLDYIAEYLNLGSRSFYLTDNPANAREVLLRIETVYHAEAAIFSPAEVAPPAAEVSTLPAAALTQFLTGADPTSSELDLRASAARSAYDYYANVLDVANPRLGPYESLGVSFSSHDAFRAKFGTGDDAAFIAKAYQEVFLRAPTAAQQQSFAAQVAYFIGLYERVGLSPAIADTQARGAVLGQMIGYVMTDPAESGRSGQTIDDRAVNFVAGLPSIALVGQGLDLQPE